MHDEQETLYLTPVTFIEEFPQPPRPGPDTTFSPFSPAANGEDNSTLRAEPPLVFFFTLENAKIEQAKESLC